jgi:hypothetical protein
MHAMTLELILVKIAPHPLQTPFLMSRYIDKAEIFYWKFTSRMIVGFTFYGIPRLAHVNISRQGTDGMDIIIS